MKRTVSVLLALTMLLTLMAVPAQASENILQSIPSLFSSKSEQREIEKALNLKNNEDVSWTYDKDSDSWIMGIVSTVTKPEIPEKQGVSVCVPGAYVTGIDTDKDGKADVTSSTYTDEVKGSLVINPKGKKTSTNGQVYTAKTAPVIMTTGGEGYASKTNTLAATTYAKDGYINLVSGNRGKQDTVSDSAGNTKYTGDAPSTLVDQKNTVRFIKYNILLDNLPGSVDHFVSTGGSGGGAHATMLAVTSNNPDFYDYEIEAGAVGVYKDKRGNYCTKVNINGKSVEISDGVWGCMAYSPITSLAEADMAMAFEYSLDTTYDFGTSFQKQLAEDLSLEYMDYINKQDLKVKESQVGFDLNKDGDKNDTVKLTIQYNKDKHPKTNGFYGTYLNLYLAEFKSNLQWYLDNLDYATDWTWFHKDGSKMTDKQVKAMSTEDKANAFLEGRYTKGASSKKGPMGMPAGLPEGAMPVRADGESMLVGTPMGGTQAAGSKTDSSNYKTYDEMVAAYEEDIKAVQQGDRYGNNQVELYNPLNYIGDKDTEDPTWVRMMCGASEGDISMFNSLNLQIKMLGSGIDADVEWQWDGGHVPSEVLSSTFSQYVDTMYSKHVNHAKVTPNKATKQTKNGTADKAEGTDLTSWVNSKDIHNVSFKVKDVAKYRTDGASKATPAFDVIDYGQEDYVFGNAEKDARHWNETLLKIFKEDKDTLEPLFNKDA